MPSLMTTADLAIAYTPRQSDMVYDVHLDGLWVASATTFHVADLVADEVRYNAFLSFDPPGDDPAPETGLGSSDDEGDDPDATCHCGAPASITIHEGATQHYICDNCYQNEFYGDERANWHIV